MSRPITTFWLTFGLLAFVVWEAAASLSSNNVGVGVDPNLPEPESKLIPTVNIAPAKGWPENKKPVVAEGLEVNAFSSDLDHPRWIYVLPNGDVLVAETNAPPKPGEKGFRAWVMRLVMKKAGAGVQSANRITLLRDTDSDGVADFTSVFLEKLNSPFGMALIDNNLYVANSDEILIFHYESGMNQIKTEGKRLTKLPAGAINHHWTKNIIASADNSKIYATVGSNSNIAENGMEAEHERAAILEIDAKTGSYKVFASGLRNPNGLAWQRDTGALWTVVNERDELGNDLVPDYLTSVTDGGFYGWPYSYFGQHVDHRVSPQRPDLVAKAIKPDYALGSHTAPLGLVSSYGSNLLPEFSTGMFIGQHGSWNRKPLSGYKVIYVPFEKGMATGMPLDVLTGFINENGEAYGRPVGVAIDADGALLVADDVGNKIWRVSKKKVFMSGDITSAFM